MPFLPALALVVLGLVLIAVPLGRAFRALRGFRQAASMVAANTQDRAGLLRARSAALRVAFAERRRVRGGDPAGPENQ